MTALNSVPAQASKGPRLELPDVVEGDVEELEVADVCEGVLVDLCVRLLDLNHDPWIIQV